MCNYVCDTNVTSFSDVPVPHLLDFGMLSVLVAECSLMLAAVVIGPCVATSYAKVVALLHCLTVQH